MDNFVNRLPTWKTKSYSQVTHISTKKNEKVKTARKSISQPLKAQQQIQPLAIMNIQAASSSTSNRRLTITSDDLLKILTEPLSAPPIGETSVHDDDSGLSSSSSNGAEHFGIDEQDNDENINVGIYRKHLSDLSDYVNGSQPKATLKVSHTTTTLPIPVDAVRTQEDVRHRLHSPRKVPVSVPLTQPYSNVTDCVTPKSVRKQTTMMSRIHRDLDSPSATVRIRAMKALRSPTKSAYSNFDVSHTEQEIITAQEREAPPSPISLEELMRNIVVYVEIRSGEDNRSAGVKKVISAMGARVNDKLLRNTTHVIFKDGRLSTYKKAKELNIPIVSILWIEACKNQRQICNPLQFPISNVDRYENPELYEKMKRVKSMQPDSELTKRIRLKPSTPKPVTPSKKRSPKTVKTLKCDTPTTSKKTDITQFFKKVETPYTKKTEVSSTITTGANCDSPATQLLNRMTSNDYNPLKRRAKDSVEDQIEENDSTYMQDDKTGNFITPNVINPLETLANVTTIQETLENAIDSQETTPNVLPPAAEEIIATIPSKTAVPQRRMSMRRRSMLAETIPSTSTIETVVVENSKLRNTTETISEPSLTKPKQPARRRNSSHIIGNGPTELKETAGETSRTPKRYTPRRRSMCAITDNEKYSAKEVGSSNNGFNAIAEEEDEPVSIEKNDNTVLSNDVGTPMDVVITKSSEVEVNKPKAMTRRRSTYSTLSLDISNLNAEQPILEREVRRLTTYTPQQVDETLANNKVEKLQKNYVTVVKKVHSEGNLTMLGSQSDFGAQQKLQQRPTLFTPQRIEENSLNGSANREVKASLSATPQPQFGSLLEEHANMVTFNSARLPGKRRTLFDVSMDIISKRVETINQKRRQSMAIQSNDPSTPTNNDNSRDATSQQSTPIVQAVTEKAQENITAAETDTTTPRPKKRKLFTPNDSILLTPTTSAGAQAATPSSVAKRRTLMPVMQPQSAGKILTATKTSTSLASDVSQPKKSRRRSTMDFETAHKVKTAPPIARKKIPTSITTAATGETCGKKALPLIVCTNMRREQIEVIQEALVVLGGFQLEHYVNSGTTHVVSLEPRRTLNMLLALVRGLWILDFKWIVDSLHARKWLNEESYEMKDFSRAVEICRAERQAFGNSYKCELFTHLGSFYISHRCAPVQKDDLKELILLCGGRVADNRKRAKYILGDVNRKFEEKIYITPFWVLDSITQMQLLKFSQYHCFPEVPPMVQLVNRQPPQLKAPSEISSMPADEPVQAKYMKRT